MQRRWWWHWALGVCLVAWFGWLEPLPAQAQWWSVPPLKTNSYVRGRGRIRIRREETEATHQVYVRPCWWNYDICADQWGDSQTSGYYGGWSALGNFGPGGATTVTLNTGAFVNPENLIDVRIWSSHYDNDFGFIGYARHAIGNPYGTVDQVHGAIEFNGRYYCGDPGVPGTWRDISDLVWSANYFLGAACVEDWRRTTSGGDRDFNDLAIVADLTPGTTLVHRHLGYAGGVPMSACYAYGYAYDEARGGARQSVQIYLNGNLLTTVTANQFNASDPGACPAVGGYCGFSFNLAPYVAPNVPYTVEARTPDEQWGNRWVTLTDSPRLLTCVNATATPTPTLTNTPTTTPTRTSTPSATPTVATTLTLNRDHPYLVQCGLRVGEPTQVLRGELTGNANHGRGIRIAVTDPTLQATPYAVVTDTTGHFELTHLALGNEPCFGSTLTGTWSAQAFDDVSGLASNVVQWRVAWFVIHTTK